MKNYIKPIIEEEVIETEDIIMVSPQASGEINPENGVNVGDLFSN